MSASYSIAPDSRRFDSVDNPATTDTVKLVVEPSVSVNARISAPAQLELERDSPVPIPIR